MKCIFISIDKIFLTHKDDFPTLIYIDHEVFSKISYDIAKLIF